jgi:CheY-like chemotaxis protein
LLISAVANAVSGPNDAVEEQESTGPSRDRAAPNQGLRVLLAEDNPVNQKFAIRAIEKNGHSVIVANNGREAVDVWRHGTFDVVLMDVQMPDMDGLQATATIRELEREGGTETRTPIIAMTANAMKGDRERCLEAGMDGYVSKPVKQQTLFAEIDRVLGAD